MTSFIPKLLYEQFRCYTNIFFLCIGLLQQNHIFLWLFVINYVIYIYMQVFQFFSKLMAWWLSPN